MSGDADPKRFLFHLQLPGEFVRFKHDVAHSAFGAYRPEYNLSGHLGRRDGRLGHLFFITYVVDLAFIEGLLFHEDVPCGFLTFHTVTAW